MSEAMKALLWKDWRQLRLLRILGAGLMLTLPLFLLAAAEASYRGWLPVARTASYSAVTVLVDAVPPFMVGAWGLFALFMTTQLIVGDRAAGTEAFLLGSPIRRNRIWLSRLAASFGSILTMAGIGFLSWAAYAVLAAGQERAFGSSAVWILLAGGASTIVVAFVGGICAGSLVSSPMPAVLTGLIIGGLPVVLSMALGSTFPYASIATIPVGAIVPLLLFPALIWVSYRVLCVGEPAGRGRYLRAAKLFSGSLACVAVLFVLLAAVAVRASTWGAGRNTSVIASPSGTHVLSIGGWPHNTGTLVDTATAERTHSFGMPTYTGAWSRDGRYLAVVSEGGPLGMRSASARIEIYDTAVGRIVHTLSCDRIGLRAVAPSGLDWSETALIVRGWDMRNRLRLYSITQDDWQPQRLEVTLPSGESRRWQLIGPADDGSAYVVVPTVSQRPIQRETLRVYPVDLERGIGTRPAFEFSAVFYDLQWRLSPSGRYWVLSSTRDEGSLVILEIATGERIVLDTPVFQRAHWLIGDTLIWREKDAEEIRIRSWKEGAEPSELLAVPSESRFDMVPSPDRRRLLLALTDAPEWIDDRLEGTAITPGKTLIYDADGGAWSRLDYAVSAYGVGVWAGPQMIVTRDDSGLSFHGI